MKLRAPFIERVSRRQLRRGNLAKDEAKAVRAVLGDQIGMRLIVQRVAEIPEVVAAAGDDEETFLEKLARIFLTKILPLMLAIAKALGLI